jgi:hypothetical protein
MIKTAPYNLETVAIATLREQFPDSGEITVGTTDEYIEWTTASGDYVIHLLHDGRSFTKDAWMASGFNTRTGLKYVGCDWTDDVDTAVASLADQLDDEGEGERPRALFGAEHIVTTLNQMLEADPVALTSLFSVRVPSNDELAHAWPEVVRPGDDHFLGLIGILNGIAGTVHAGQPRISMSVTPSGTIEYFEFAVPDQDA